MRFNRNTAILLAISLVVIVAVLFLSSNQASAPTNATSTPARPSGPLFAGLDPAGIVRIEVRDNTSGEALVISRDAEGPWSIDETAYPQERNPDQAQITEAVNSLAALTFTDSFGSDEIQNFDLANYGLDEPTHTMSLTTEDDSVYTIYVGSRNPGETRFYVRVEATPSAESTAEPGDLPSADNIYLVLPINVNNLIELITAPPYEPTPTPTSTPFPTPNPVSEVDQTATAAVQQTATQQALEATAEATAEATGEATAEP